MLTVVSSASHSALKIAAIPIRLLVSFFHVISSVFHLCLFILKFLVECLREHQEEQKHREDIQAKLANVSTYKEYVELASELDKLNGFDIWKREHESELYDYEQIEDNIYHLEELYNNCKAQLIKLPDHLQSSSKINPSSSSSQPAMTTTTSSSFPPMLRRIDEQNQDIRGKDYHSSHRNSINNVDMTDHDDNMNDSHGRHGNTNGDSERQSRFEKNQPQFLDFNSPVPLTPSWPSCVPQNSGNTCNSIEDRYKNHDFQGNHTGIPLTVCCSPSIYQLCSVLRSLANRNIGGTGHPQLYKCAVGTKHLIQDYIDQVRNIFQYIYEFNTHYFNMGDVPALVDMKKVCKLLRFVKDTEFHGFSLLDKYNFFKDTAQAFGRSALLLSGGASLGMYHVGVIKALFDQGLLPRIISGTSAGSIVASIICTRTEEEIPKCFERGYYKFDAFKNLDNSRSPIRKLMRFIKSGVLMDIKRLESCLKENIGDLTFQEAYQRSGRILNITVNSQKGFTMPSLLNFITAPNVLIWSACCASCCIPGVFQPATLMAKDKFGNIVPYHSSSIKFNDGSLYFDLPQIRLSELFGVNFFIVSQVNPHVLPFLSDNDDATGNIRSVWRKVKHFVFSEVKYRLLQLYEYNLVPKKLNILEGIISQQYTGDITILPATLNLNSLSKLLKNPSDEYIQECIIQGQQKTFPKISIIQNKCTIERMLDECLLEIREKLLHPNHAVRQFQRMIPEELIIPYVEKKLLHASSVREKDELLETVSLTINTSTMYGVGKRDFSG